MNLIKDPIKDTLVPLPTNFNANGSVRWLTSVFLNLFHWPMGKNSGNCNGVCRYVPSVSTKIGKSSTKAYLNRKIGLFVSDGRCTLVMFFSPRCFN